MEAEREGGAGAVWAVAGREAVQHADSDAGWRLGRRDLGLNLVLRPRPTDVRICQTVTVL